ncbi:MAG TPA: hypothetical protein VF765_11635 [Polyangiaceae bacterium]
MRKALGFASAAAVVLLAFACSPSSSHPPVEGCGGAGCGSSGGGASSGGTSSSGGTDGGGDDAATNCGVPSNGSQCSLCLADKCCTQLTGCTQDMACNSVSGCVLACGGGSTCITMCENTFPAGTTLYEELSSCAQRCIPCTEEGTGDPCGGLTSYACASTLSCNGQWCTPATCTQDSDCTGLGQSGGNYLGRANACVRGANGGLTCAPGCMSPGDCSAFSGAICRVATDASGSLVSVCGSVTDAATE